MLHQAADVFAPENVVTSNSLTLGCVKTLGREWNENNTSHNTERKNSLNIILNLYPKETLLSSSRPKFKYLVLNYYDV